MGKKNDFCHIITTFAKLKEYLYYMFNIVGQRRMKDMNYTTFNTALSHLSSFNTIGYDKETETLHIQFFNGDDKTYHNVPEALIFKLLISEDKESFYHEYIEQEKSTYSLT